MSHLNLSIDSVLQRKQSTDAGPVLKIDAASFDTHFNRSHFKVRHGLADHPLFALPRLAALAQEVARRWPRDIVVNHGVTDIGQRWEAQRAAFSLAETVPNMPTTGAWIDLRSAERDPAYARVLDACIGDLLRLSKNQLKTKIRRTQMAIFMTSPKRISTYHIDSECNFLLQIRGQKAISIFNKFDREVLPEQEIERAWSVDTNAAVYKPALQARADVVPLAPGEGVHIPINAPHWVQNGDEVSVSAAILYHTWDRHYANVYAANYFLRKRFGREPTPPFRSPGLDLLKQPLGKAFICARRLVHGPLREY